MDINLERFSKVFQYFMDKMIIKSIKSAFTEGYKKAAITFEGCCSFVDRP